ncbi:unnamed protein product [Caenorhabditis nigoni]
MEKKNEQYSRSKFIEEQLEVLKAEEAVLLEVRMTLQNQKWQLLSEHDKIKEKIKQRDAGEPEVEMPSEAERSVASEEQPEDIDEIPDTPEEGPPPKKAKSSEPER